MVSDRQKATRQCTKKRECAADPAESKTPRMQRNRVPLGAREPGDPVAAREQYGGPEGEGDDL